MIYNVRPRQVLAVKFDGINIDKVREVVGPEYKVHVYDTSIDTNGMDSTTISYITVNKDKHSLKINPGCYVVKEISGRVYNYNQEEFNSYLFKPYNFSNDTLD